MANILAAQNGNFNATSTWTGGVVPGVGDTAYVNNRTITITADITCDKISNLAENGSTAGGTCNVALTSSDNRTINANLDSGTSNLFSISESSAGGIITFNGVFKNFTSRTISFGVASLSTRLVVNGPMYAGSSFNNACVYISGGAVTITGDLYASGQHPGGGGPVGQSSAVATQTGTAVITINGNLYPGPNNNTPALNIFTNSNGTAFQVTINGNITGATGASPGVNITQGGTGGSLIINGDVTGSANTSTNFTGAGVVINNGTSNFSITINGSCIGGLGSPGLYVNGTGGTVNVQKAIGNAYGFGSVGISVPMEGVINNSQALVYIRDMECGVRGVPPFRGNVFAQNLTTVYFKSALSASSSKTLTDPSATADFPSNANVRSGIVFASGNRTGTCAVPAANSVAAGVAVGNTVGTAVLTQANVWDYALSSASSVAGSVGEKLKKTAIPADIIALG